MAERKIVLAYSGGLDTSVAIRWLAERHNADIITLTADLGGDTSLENARQRALDIGATHAIIKDLRGAFIEEFIFPTLQAGAVYEGHYPLATALGRPLIARTMVEVAHREGAFAVAHGSTGKALAQGRQNASSDENKLLSHQCLGTNGVDSVVVERCSRSRSRSGGVSTPMAPCGTLTV